MRRLYLFTLPYGTNLRVEAGFRAEIQSNEYWFQCMVPENEAIFIFGWS